MRLSDADREALLETVKRHAAAGVLDLAELERRVEQIVLAETREQAEMALADLPRLTGPDAPESRSAAPSEAGPGSERPRWGRGHGHADAPEQGWTPTGERFRDPRSNKVMRVWEDASGGRHYVPDR